MTKVRLLKRTTIYQGRVIRLIQELLQVDHQRLVRETILHPGAVVVAPLLHDGRLVFVRQYRRSVDRELLELPAGTLEVGESPERCARRELEEETGWRARHLRRVGQFYAAPGIISEQLTLFVATGLTQVGARPEPDELLTPVTLSLTRAISSIRSGAICDAKSIIGVLLVRDLLARKRVVVKFEKQAP